MYIYVYIYVYIYCAAREAGYGGKGGTWSAGSSLLRRSVPCPGVTSVIPRTCWRVHERQTHKLCDWSRASDLQPSRGVMSVRPTTCSIGHACQAHNLLEGSGEYLEAEGTSECKGMRGTKQMYSWGSSE